MSPPPVQSLGLPGPDRACPVLQARPTCRRALHMLSLVRSLLTTLQLLYSFYSTASSTATLPYIATLQPICSLYYSVYSLYSYSSHKTFYETYNLPQWPSAPGAHTHTHTHTHTGFFFKGFLPLDTREPRISFSPNHFTLFLHSLEHFLAHLEGGGGAYTVYGSLSLSLSS